MIATLVGCAAPCGDLELELPLAGDHLIDSETCGSDTGTWMAPDGGGGTLMHVQGDALLDADDLIFVSVTLLGELAADTLWSVADGTLTGASWWIGEAGIARDLATLAVGELQVGAEGDADDVGSAVFSVVWALQFGDPEIPSLPWTLATGEDEVAVMPR